METILPLEIEIPSRRIALQNYITDETTHHMRLDQLILLDERRVNALEYLCTYQSCIKWAFDRKIKIHEFNIGDLFLKEN